METVVIIRLGRMGDVTLTAPTTKNLRFLYPNAKILFVTRRRYSSLAAMLPGVDQILDFPDNGSYFDLIKLSSEIDEYNPDLIVDLHKNFRSFHISTMSHAPFKVVYHKRRKEREDAVASKNFVTPVPHTIDLYNEVIDQLHGIRLAHRPDLVLPDDALSGATGVRDGVALVPGASSPVKAWPAERFVAIAERIIFDFKQPVHVFLGEAEGPFQDYFRRLPQEFLTFYHNHPLDEIAVVLSQRRLTLTNDSGLMHVSSAVGTPTTALFGPTHEQLGFYPRGIHDTVLATSEQCRPCSLHGNKACSREEQFCFTLLTVDMVYEKVAARLDALPLDPAVFIDRDGTLIEDKHYLADPAKIAFFPGALEAVGRLKQAGYKIVVISNQSGVARAFFTVETVEKVHEELRRQMQDAQAEPDDIRFCPHLPDGDDSRYTGECDCRKPKAGMLEAAAVKLGLDVKRSVVIGDKYADIQCGKVLGARSLLVRTGEGTVTESELPAHAYLRPYHISDGLAAAVDNVLGQR